MRFVVKLVVFPAGDMWHPKHGPVVLYNYIYIYIYIYIYWTVGEGNN